MEIKDQTAYGLGKRAHKAGRECLPHEDKIFWDYVTESELPVVETIRDYVSGYYARKDAKDAEAKARRKNFKVIK